jgi:molybdopterin/thiamine biosynthesis adenylyltransferase
MDHTRHQGIFNASAISATLVGAGGIGAITALTLAKMGVRYLTVYDDDTVSSANIPTQFHKVAHVGVSKVHALADTLSDFSDEIDLTCCSVRVADTSLSDQVIISAVDSIQARKDIWKAAKGHCSWYLDARMAAEEFHLYTVPSGNTGWYEKMLSQEDDALIAELPCTAKATIYCGTLAAAIIGSTVRKIITAQAVPRIFIQNLRTSTLFVQE